MDTSEESDDQRIQDVVTIEQPPRSEIEAMERWHAARQRFLRRLHDAEQLQKRAQACYEAVERKPIAVQQVDEKTRDAQSARRALTSSAEKEAIAKQVHASAVVSERQAADERVTMDRLRPGFFSRLFATRRYREWRSQMETAQRELRQARTTLKATAEAERLATQAVAAATMEVRDREQKQKYAQAELARFSSIIEAMRSQMGTNLADDQFWAQDASIVEGASPWIHDEWQKVRASLFVEAFALHRAFIDAAAKPLRHNLRAAIEVLKGRALNAQQEVARPSLWASLFLVVPVVSTTFASTSRLFGPLGREQLGWLLVDEAGQATPQAAVGAIWRAKRSIIIGDPLQIQPVVTTPQKLIRAIFGEFAVSPEAWAAPEMSAQTLADRVSWFGTDIRTNAGDIWVGSPLRVHRRCENPMFKISNYVAYDGLMVYGTAPGVSQIGDILGDSRWIDTATDDAMGKWSESEGQTAVTLLRTLLDADLKDPDVYFITPFRIVAQKLRQLMQRDVSISQRLSTGVWDWTHHRVGTIHTFQGKEADAVILVLGAPAEASAGARRWAGYPPNLLNVAVTRAKRRIYVIGKRDAWKDAGAFSHLAQLLPVDSWPAPQ